MAEESLDAAGGRHVVARLVLTGRGSLHRWLHSGDTAAAIREQINDHWADRATWLWCEGVQLDTAAPVDRDLLAQREDFLGDLARLAGEMRESNGALAEFRQLLQPLYSRRELRALLREFVPSDDELRALLAAAEEECLAELAPEEE